jgi:hypothetical protein
VDGDDDFDVDRSSKSSKDGLTVNVYFLQCQQMLFFVFILRVLKLYYVVFFYNNNNNNNNTKHGVQYFIKGAGEFFS